MVFYLRRAMKTIFYTLFAVITLATLCACNTMRGVGEDVSVAGRDIQRAAR